MLHSIIICRFYSNKLPTPHPKRGHSGHSNSKLEWFPLACSLPTAVNRRSALLYLYNIVLFEGAASPGNHIKTSEAVRYSDFPDPIVSPLAASVQFVRTCSPYVGNQAEAPKWKPQAEIAAAAFIEIALWVVFDTGFCTVRVFQKEKKRKGKRPLLLEHGRRSCRQWLECRRRCDKIIRCLGTQRIWPLHTFVLLTGCKPSRIGHPIQTFSYALKLKLDSVVLHQSMAVAAQGIERRSLEDRAYPNADAVDYFSAHCRRWADKPSAQPVQADEKSRKPSRDGFGYGQEQISRPSSVLPRSHPTPAIPHKGRKNINTGNLDNIKLGGQLSLGLQTLYDTRVSRTEFPAAPQMT